MRHQGSFYTDRFVPDEHLQNTYNDFNELFFNSRLPYVRVGFYPFTGKKKFYGMTITFSKAKYPFYILLNEEFKIWNNTNYTTLLHEMIHVKLLGKHGHGKKFQKEKVRLLKAGAFTPYL